MSMTMKSFPLTFCLSLLPLASATAQEASAGVDPQADRLLRAMSDHLAGLAQFRVRTDNTLDVVTWSGQKLQMANDVTVTVQRPARLRASRRGDVDEQEFYYDGKTLSLHSHALGFYASVEVPDNLDDMLDFAREQLGLIAPAADLLHADSYQALMEDVQEGSYIGLSRVAGVDCHHLAFRNQEVDWQIWIADGDAPQPCKYLITTKWVTGAPQFTAVFADWYTSPSLDEDLFTFTPPEDAQRIDFMAATAPDAP